VSALNGVAAKQGGEIRLSNRVRREFGAPLAVVVILMFPVAYWVAIPAGQVSAVLSIHIAVTVGCILALLGLLRVRIQLTADGIDELGFFGRTMRLPREEVKSIVLNEIYLEQGSEVRTNLFALDSQKRVRLRMRGQFWSVAQMETVADHLGVRVEVRPGRRTLAEIRRSSPQWLYWFERRPSFLHGDPDDDL
jgi:hypothetical protein